MRFHDFFAMARDSLLENFKEINTWFGKPEGVRSYTPEDGGWTINQILEHISLTNHFLLILIDKAKDKAVKNPMIEGIGEFIYEKETLERMEKIGEHKSFEWIRPEHMEPKGDVSLEEVKKTLKEQVCLCLDILDLLKNGEGLNTKTKMSVNDIGKIDVYQYIYFLSLHGERHIEQMEKNEKEYNKKKNS